MRKGREALKITRESLEAMTGTWKDGTGVAERTGDTEGRTADE